MNLATMRVPALLNLVCAKKTLYLCAFLLVGCTAPQINPWDSVEIPSEVIETPLPCNELPAPEALDEIPSNIERALGCTLAEVREEMSV